MRRSDGPAPMMDKGAADARVWEQWGREGGGLADAWLAVRRHAGPPVAAGLLAVLGSSCEGRTWCPLESNVEHGHVHQQARFDAPPSAGSCRQICQLWLLWKHHDNNTTCARCGRVTTVPWVSGASLLRPAGPRLRCRSAVIYIRVGGQVQPLLDVALVQLVAPVVRVV
jgi:hypothetical protein